MLTPTVIILFALIVVELNGVSPSNVKRSALSISFVLIVTVCILFGRTTNGSGGFKVSPTKIILVPIDSLSMGLKKYELPKLDISLKISSFVLEISLYERSTMPMCSRSGLHCIVCDSGSKNIPIGG